MKRLNNLLLAVIPVMLLSCNDEGEMPSIKDPEPGIFKVPVVVHVIHHGEPVGVGHNLSKERIEGQIGILNEDYRRKEGTRGFNDHPDGGDAEIEFTLARSTPDGTETDGIVRINVNATDNPVEPGKIFDYYAHYSYWDPEKYLNVWTLPLPKSTIDVFLGRATGPDTDLPGAELFEQGEPHQAEGVLINSAHFGESDLDSNHNLGRTLTHEIGHYLGLLHPWGSRDCETNDYCADTPPVNDFVKGCPSQPLLACDGRQVMIANYMNYTHDQCMNIFTNDQIGRMHYVLENSPRRKTLLKSSGLSAP